LRIRAQGHSFPNMFPDFSPSFSKEVRDEAMAYLLSKEPDENLPEGLDLDTIADLHDRALDGDTRVVPLLKALIPKHPEYPTLRNYLAVALRQCGRERQSFEIERETLRLHPDYLFARINEAQRLIGKQDFVKAREILGGGLRLSDIHPAGKDIHISEWKNYYATVALFYSGAGDPEAAQGVINAIESKGDDPGLVKQLTYSVMLSRLEKLRQSAKESMEKEIRVKCPPRPKAILAEACCEPVHPVIYCLYEFADDFPQEAVDEILALPRNEAISDLTAILEKGITNAPFYFRDDEACWEQIHALFLLSEMKAQEALETALRFLGQHPDFIDFYFGDFISWQPIMGIIGGDLPRLAEWMKTPGLCYEGRSFVLSAVTELPAISPERHGEAVAWLAGLLAFFRDSPPEDNILDTRLVTDLVDSLVTLRAAEHEALIREVYAKDYVSEVMIGSVDDNLRRLPEPPGQKILPGHEGMIAFYRTLRKNQDRPPQPGPPNPIFEQNPFGKPPSAAPETAAAAGRNDPCPCGSGRKYKKCCMKG
jgi:tetratricopeptide (TPR) repeat protein